MDDFGAAFTRAGLQVVDREILLDCLGFYAGYYRQLTLLTRRPDLDVVYFYHHEMAIGGLTYCQNRGIRVPEDMGIVGFGGMAAASVLPRRLTPPAVPTTQISKQAAEALVARSIGEPVQDVTVIAARLVPEETD